MRGNEISAVKSPDAAEMEIADLAGIKYFTALEKLN